MRFGIKSHLEINSIISLAHICNVKNKIPTSWQVKTQDKGGESREEQKIFSFLVFSLFASHVAKSFSLRSNNPRYTNCWATQIHPYKEQASLFTFSEYALQILMGFYKTVSIN